MSSGDFLTLVTPNQDYSTSQATLELRWFVSEYGNAVLQQKWRTIFYHDGNPIKDACEWRDVPIESGHG